MVFTEEMRSRFFRDGRRIFYEGYKKNHGPRVWLQDIEGGAPRAVGRVRASALTPIVVAVYFSLSNSSNATPSCRRILKKSGGPISRPP